MGESRPPQTSAGRAVVRGRRETVGGPDLAPAGHAEVLEQRLETVVDARGVPSAVGPRLAGLVRFASGTSRREVQYARRAPSWGSLRGRGFGVKNWYSVCRRESRQSGCSSCRSCSSSRTLPCQRDLRYGRSSSPAYR